MCVCVCLCVCVCVYVCVCVCVVCNIADSPIVINLAVSMASAHGGVSAVCARNREEVQAIETVKKCKPSKP